MNQAEQRVWDAAQQMAAKRERWLQQEARERGLTNEQFAKLFALEVSTTQEVDDLGHLCYVDRLRLIPKAVQR